MEGGNGAPSFFDTGSSMGSFKQRNAPRSPRAKAAAWERRTEMIKREAADASAAVDSKIARLRALRLERDSQRSQTKSDGPGEPST